jgi:adenine-specific DNA-methyltransferase
VIKYLGSKRLLVPRIVEIVAALDAVRPVRTVLDLFAGTSRVGHALKAAGCRVLANDDATYAQVLATAYVQADAEDWAAALAALLPELAAAPPVAGYVTRTFCEEARYFTPENGARIDGIRAAIAARALSPELEALALTALLEAADRVDSTTGLQMAYLKRWAPRAANPLVLRTPALLPRARHGKGAAHRLDALDAARALAADVAYLDPPYNQHSYLGNYHAWETIARGDEPAAYGVARKRVDTRERRSRFNSRRQHAAALREVIAAVDARVLIVSFSDEGFVTRDEVTAMLAPRGEVLVFAHDFKRYVGAQIGIHNPRGEKVGRVSHLRNREFLFVAGPAEALARLRAAAEPAPLPA